MSNQKNIKFKDISNNDFFCFNCGHKLNEIRLGFLYCENCNSTFVPFMDLEDCQCLSNLTKDEE